MAQGATKDRRTRRHSEAGVGTSHRPPRAAAAARGLDLSGPAVREKQPSQGCLMNSNTGY